VAVTGDEYATPTMPAASEEVVIASAGLIVSARVRVTVRCVGVVASVTVTLTLLVPEAVGLPETTPDAASMERPAGKPVADQAYGVVPPVAVTEAE
jgi:hypothetical protein